jgi:hypothetical protein
MNLYASDAFLAQYKSFRTEIMVALAGVFLGMVLLFFAYVTYVQCRPKTKFMNTALHTAAVVSAMLRSNARERNLKDTTDIDDDDDTTKENPKKSEPIGKLQLDAACFIF